MKVLIVDDEPLARAELRYLLEQNPKVNEINESEGVITAQALMEEFSPDLLFLDIKLDDGNGMALAKVLKKQVNRPYIVFATAYDQYALEAFNADAIDYILKPFEQNRINETIERVARILGDASHPLLNTISYQNPRLSVTNEERTVVIKKRDILYLEAQSGNVVVRSKTLKPIISKQTLASLTEQLNPRQFVKVHRSYVVNLDAVVELQPSFNHTYELTLNDGSKVPVSRYYVNNTKRSLGMK
jgi:two-component system response regulator LytT